MRVLLVTQYFYPEFFKSNDIAFVLAERGYEVEVLTSIPNYPAGKYYDGYGILKKRVKVVRGVKIYRAFQFPRGRRHSGVRLALNYLSYAVSSTFWTLWFALFKKRYDAIIVHLNSPITQTLPAIVLGKLTHSPVYTWILDIWPDAMRSGGGVNNEKIISLVDAFVQWVYRNSTKILISSKGFKPLINRKADYSDKIIYYPNWCDDILSMPHPPVETLPEGFKVMMAGNLGSAQDIRTVMKAVLLTKNHPEIKWVFVGDGSEKAFMEQFVAENGLQETVIMTGKRPFEEMPSFYAQADMMLLTLRAGFPHLQAVVPTRLQSYMSAGKPVVGMINGGSVELITECRCGYCVNAGDYKGLATKVIYMYEHQSELEEMGRNARRLYEQRFTKDKCISNLEQIIA
jgi:glycosyltransferase involved in cell wall biosynthesis